MGTGTDLSVSAAGPSLAPLGAVPVCYNAFVVGALTTVVLIMLVAILIVALGPIAGVAVWLLCLSVVLSLAKRLRRHVWGHQSRPNQ